MLLLAGGVAYSWLICTFLSPYAGGADSSGYLNFARLLTQGQVLAPVRALPGHAVAEFHAGTYQPQGFVIRDDSGFMAPTYPVGLPLHLVLASWLVGVKLRGRACQRTRSACGRRAHVCVVPPLEARSGLGRGRHLRALPLAIFSVFGATADERPARDDLGARRALCRDAQPRARVLDHLVRGGVWHCSAHPSHQRSVSVADPRGIGVSSFSACRRRPWRLSLRIVHPLFEFSALRLCADHWLR